MTDETPKPEVARDELGLTAEERAGFTDQELVVLADMPRVYARMTTHSVMAAERVIKAAEKSPLPGKTLDWRGAMEELQALSAKLRTNDMAPAEDMLAHQAVALQALFTRLTEMAFQADLHRFDLFMRYALRAQAQGRATIEALAEIKNPPVLFARQANIANGPQQVNNGVARAGELKSHQNELSGEAIELRQNGSTPKLAFAPDSALAAVGAIDGSAHTPGKDKIVSERVEGERPRSTSRVGKGAQVAGQKSGLP